ncbi:MAG: low molecular weight protein arginine phosphatase [Dethiobacter sp.]|nr:low molecular weight protein arginine phosphatase [Dethiobacter sp.]MBS3898451.1 low molecular weight protein arginine phosphatase [Dethiobacter sp.]MBS3982705.1 low molecular weight protein arginine phosphatase [Dethiobacter sp.]MCL4463541.1 low molecular weight protein arginine phosphatase [Bacillota bacterium]
MMAKKCLLFVCTGNTCRSPLAKVLTEAALRASGVDGWEVASAGLAAHPGMAASAEAGAVAREAGLDLALHRAKPLSAELLARAELVLVMTAGHKTALLAGAAGYADKIYTVKEYLSFAGDVADPFGGGLASYRQTAQELHSLVSLLVEKLKG